MSVEKIAQLVKEKEKMERYVERVSKTKHWTEITILGEDGAENKSSFSIGGPGDNDKANLNLVKHIHDVITTHYNVRLKETNYQIKQLLK